MTPEQIDRAMALADCYAERYAQPFESVCANQDAGFEVPTIDATRAALHDYLLSTIKESLTVAEQSAELDAGMAAQHYCRGLWGAARGHSDWRKVHEHFANGYKQGRYDEIQAQGPDKSIWDKYAPVQHEDKT